MAASVAGDAHRVLAPGQFIGVSQRAQTPSGAICLITLKQPRPQVDEHEHADTHIVFVSQGHYRTNARDTEGWLGPGSAIFHPPGTRHRDRLENAGAVMAFSLSEAFLNACSLGGVAPRSESDQGRRIDQREASPLLAAICSEVRAPDEVSTLSIEAMSFELMAALARQRDRDTRGPPAWLRRCHERIADELSEPVRISALAQDVGVHPVHLARTFRRFIGVSPADYIRRARLTRAARLLAKTETPLSEIAQACGFCDQASFTKAFRKAMAASPAAFRRTWRS